MHTYHYHIDHFIYIVYNHTFVDIRGLSICMKMMKEKKARERVKLTKCYC